MYFLINFILIIIEFMLIIFLGYLFLPKILEHLFKNHTGTYIYKKKDFRAPTPEISTQLEIPELIIDKKTGTYSVQFGVDRKLENGIVRIYFNDQWYSSNPLSNEKQLILKKVDENIGIDKLGKYKITSIEWQLGTKPEKILTNFYYYNKKPYIIFEQKFLAELKTGINKFNIPITQFPCFKNESPNKRRFLFKNRIFSPPSSKKNPTSGPILYYDDKLQGFIISSLNNFLVNIINEMGADNYISCGLEGEIEKIPENYSQKFILYFGTGINNIFEKWGDILLKYYDRKRAGLYDNPIISFLGYWTDNGAYYYYKTMKGKNYQETLEALSEYFKREKIPIRYFQLDSWSYKKSWAPPIPLSLVILMNGIIDWSPNLKHFPDFKRFQKNIGNMPIACHSRYFNPKNVYIKNYKFFFSDSKLNKWVLPAEIGVWDKMLSEAKKNNIVLYEQDWMKNQFSRFKILRNNVYQARKWLLDMNESAIKNDIWIQYCMATPSMILQTLECNRVSFVRTGNDYNARFPLNLYFPHNSETAILAYSIGILPFIDCFISNNNQGPFYKSPFPELLAVQAIMSCGPVGPGDRINYLNKDLLMKTCRNDGLLLKPDKPATPIDLMFKRHSTYYITKTYSNKNNNRWYYCQIVNIWPKRAKNKSFSLKDLNIPEPRLVYDFWDKKITKLSNDQNITLNLKKNESKLLIFAPLFDDKIAVIGNPEKFITCSNTQFPEITYKDKMLSIQIKDVRDSILSVKIYSELKPEKIILDDIQLDILHITEQSISSYIYDENTNLILIKIFFGKNDTKNLKLFFN